VASSSSSPSPLNVPLPSSPPKIINFVVDKQCPVKDVTVFNDRAETSRVVHFVADKEGNYELVVGGLSEKVDKESIHVKGGVGDAVILDVSYHVIHQQEESVHEDEGQKRKELGRLQDLQTAYYEEVERIKKELKWIEGWAVTVRRGATALSSVAHPPREEKKLKKEIKGKTEKKKEEAKEEEDIEERKERGEEIEQETEVIHPADNQESGYDTEEKEIGEASSYSVDLFSEQNLANTERFIDFYDKILAKLDTRRFKVAKQIKEVEQEIQLLSASLGHKAVPKITEKREVTITIHVANPGEVQLELSYVIFGASWLASYDVRVASDDGKCQITYYGIIKNNSGENWTDTQLALSTATPSLGGAPPVLNTLYVNWKAVARNLYSEDEEETLELSKSMKKEKKEKRTISFSIPGGGSAAPKPVSVLTTQSQEAITSTSFSIPRSATILCDDKPHKVTISVIELQSRFTYTTSPKLSPYAFLKAVTQNDSQYPFLEGPTNVFVDSNFVANAQLKRVSPGEEFELFLGTDSAVKVEYKPERRVNDAPGFMSKNASQHVKQETVIKNNKAIEITIFVYEQVPLSNDEKIKVRLISPDLKQDSDKVKLNQANNLEWKVTIASKQESKFPLEYVIEWPKDRIIEFK